MRTTFIFLILSSFSSFGQINKTRLLNPQTNSYFFYSGTVHDTERKQPVNYFYLISTDTGNLKKTRIRIYTDKKSNLFIDSLKKNSFQKFAGTTNLTGKFKFKMSLNSVDIHLIDIHGIGGIDTIFRFILSINLIKANGVVISTSDTILGDKKQEILDVLQNKKYTVSVYKINKTKLLDVSINSFVLTNPNKYYFFSAGSAYSVYLLDNN